MSRSDDRSQAEGGERSPIDSIYAQIRLAASFLTILPTASGTFGPGDVARSFGWFPLVGFIIGAALAGEDYLLTLVFSPAIRALIVVMTLAIVTGGVHLDGLADSADALGAGSNRERALDIMRDSRVGSFGAIALFFVLALKTVALGGASGAVRYAAIYLAPGLARWAMVATAYRVDYLRAEGAGGTLLRRGDPRNVIVASTTVVVAALPVIGLAALYACIVALAFAWFLRAFCLRWLGGVTGDLIGAAGEIVETAVIVAATL